MNAPRVRIIPRPASLTVHAGPGCRADAAAETRRDDSLGAEGYRLSTRGERPIVTAGGDAGAQYARASLAQLVADDAGRLPAVEIGDRPRFAWRGAMLDVARRFHPVATVLALVDELAALKLNRLHLHLTDDQGWRIEIPGLPRLTEIGASTQVGGGPVAAPGYYTRADWDRIVAHAASRHIVVVPEIDLPGHTNAALTAYPDLAPTGVAPVPYEGIEVGFSTLDTRANAAVDRFVATVVDAVAAMTPGPWLHLGGDECLATPEAEFVDFIARATRLGHAAGKTIIGWHEMGRCRSLPPGTLGQYWNLTTPEPGHAERLRSFVEQGGKAIMSPADVAYLDMKRTDDDPLGLVWADGPTTLADAYGWDPADIVDGLDEDDLLGVEAPMFTETIGTLDEIRQMAFPRLAALAEVAWTPRRRRVFKDFRRRLAASPWAAEEAGR